MAEQGVYITGDHVLSPLGNGTKENLSAIAEGRSAVHLSEQPAYRDQPICAALFSERQWSQMRTTAGAGFTDFEALLVNTINAVLDISWVDLSDRKTLLLIASTKGNIGLLHPDLQDPQAETALHISAKKIGAYFNYHSLPVVVSNACISGMSALLVAKRLMNAGLYEQAIVAGADCISPFIIAGFRSFQALSDEICQPFDQDRKGINLGEAAASISLSNKPADIRLSGGSTSNDANHISGPSRTGEEMAQAIELALEQSSVQAGDIGFVSAHGTATPFNDEMESKAFMMNGLDRSPVFSLKAYFGHTLGAAGLLESAVSIEAMRQNMVIGSKGYHLHGVSQPVTIARETTRQQQIQHILKTGSGFGGCNAALVFSKNN
jgi:3-oxoacyl-[acyl-carrier-protein] synthase-1